MWEPALRAIAAKGRYYNPRVDSPFLKKSQNFNRIARRTLRLQCLRVYHALSAAQLARIREIIEAHQDEFIDAWSIHFSR